MTETDTYDDVDVIFGSEFIVMLPSNSRCLFCADIILESAVDSYWIINGPRYSGFCNEMHYQAWRERPPALPLYDEEN